MLIHFLLLIRHDGYMRCHHWGKVGDWLCGLFLYYFCNFLWVYSHFTIKSKGGGHGRGIGGSSIDTLGVEFGEIGVSKP